MPPVAPSTPLAAAEFFAGMGLVGLSLAASGCTVAYANDIDRVKQAIYEANFEGGVFERADVRDITGERVPAVRLATASFPCTDLSLAGNRLGLAGSQSGMFWEFARVLDEMGIRAPDTVLLENVPGFASSHRGEDLLCAVARLNDLGYWCDMLIINARHFVPQSRARLFIIGSKHHLDGEPDWTPSELRPAWMEKFAAKHPERRLQTYELRLPIREVPSLRTVVERLPHSHPRWWDSERLEKFKAQLSPLHEARLETLRTNPELRWATAYRRTRNGKPTWEIRADEISGCLRTARGGSSRQALVEAGGGQVRVRWMTPTEYGRLQGVPASFRLGPVSDNQALFAYGDAVCVPVVTWLLSEYVVPLATGALGSGVNDAAQAL